MFKKFNRNLTIALIDIIIWVSLFIFMIAVSISKELSTEKEVEYKYEERYKVFEVEKYEEIIKNAVETDKLNEIESRKQVLVPIKEEKSIPLSLSSCKNEYRLELNTDEMALLFNTIYLEMGSASISKDSRLVIGSVIVNRVLDERYPNTLKEVVYQKKQFSVVSKMNANKELKANPMYYNDYLIEIGYEWLAEEIWSVVDLVCIADYAQGATAFCDYSAISRANQKWFDTLELVGIYDGIHVYK